MPDVDPLAQVRELNRLFLQSLQGRDAAQLAECGFPGGAVTVLRTAKQDLIEQLAGLPRALFVLNPQEPSRRSRGGPLDVGATPQQLLQVMIVQCAWTISLRSTYHAQFFLGLTPPVLRTLRAATISRFLYTALELVRVDCAFAGAGWLWRQLLTETHPEAYRRLTMVALQPCVEGSEALDQVAERSRRHLD